VCVCVCVCVCVRMLKQNTKSLESKTVSIISAMDTDSFL